MKEQNPKKSPKADALRALREQQQREFEEKQPKKRRQLTPEDRSKMMSDIALAKPKWKRQLSGHKSEVVRKENNRRVTS